MPSARRTKTKDETTLVASPILQILGVRKGVRHVLAVQSDSTGVDRELNSLPPPVPKRASEKITKNPKLPKKSI